MVLVNIICKRCGGHGKIDIGNKSLDEIKEILKKRDAFECHLGHHFENASPFEFWEFGDIEEGKAPTDEEWFNEMIKRYKELYTSDDLSVKFNVIGFAGGMCIAKFKKSGETVYLSYSSSPSGKRYYYVG